MPDFSKFPGRTCRALFLILLAGTLLAVWVRRPSRGPRTLPLDGWDIPRLAAHLNEQGLSLRTVSTMKSGVISQSAFLTTTDKSWEDLSRLFKDPQRVRQWQGTLYCERGPACDWNDLSRHWGDCCLIVGPFLFFGDRELLARVRAALDAGRAGVRRSEG